MPGFLRSYFLLNQLVVSRKRYCTTGRGAANYILYSRKVDTDRDRIVVYSSRVCFLGYTYMQKGRFPMKTASCKFINQSIPVTDSLHVFLTLISGLQPYFYE